MNNVVIFLAFCGVAFAMVPRQERPQKVEVTHRGELANPTATSSELISTESALPETSATANSPTSLDASSTVNSSRIICADPTPCAWVIYKPTNKRVEINIPNNYCVCADGFECLEAEDDSGASAYVYKCKSTRDNEQSQPKKDT